jgi:hypothetical protein
MKRIALALLLTTGAAFAQAPATVPDQLEPETAHSLGYTEGTWAGWRLLNGALFPVQGTSFPEGQFSKWKDPICFNVYGLTPAAKVMVERRLKEIAIRVGAPVNRADPCEPNVTIAVTPDPAATLKSIADVRPWLVPGVGMICTRVRASLPVQAWYANMMRTANGFTRLTPACGGEDYYYFGSPAVQLVESMSRLESGFSTEMGAVTLIVDQKAIMGMQLGSLADYFAMLALAEGRMNRSCREFESITNLMQKDCQPGLVSKEITSNDLMLLSALYKVDDSRLTTLQAARIAHDIRKALEAEAGGGK